MALDRLKILISLLLLATFPYDPEEDVTERRINREEVERRRRQVWLARLASLALER